MNNPGLRAPAQRQLDGYRRPRSPERLATYYAQQQPDKAVIEHLRAGIAEFRSMLNARDRWAK